MVYIQSLMRGLEGHLSSYLNTLVAKNTYLKNKLISKLLIQMEMNPFKPLIQFYEGCLKKESTIKSSLSFSKLYLKKSIAKAIT